MAPTAAAEGESAFGIKMPDWLIWDWYSGLAAWEGRAR